MVLGDYSPTTVEAAALVLFFSLAAAAADSFTKISASFKWKDYMNSFTVRPVFFNPYYYAASKFAFGFIFASAFWLAFTEAYRAENGLPTETTPVLTNTKFLTIWIISLSTLLLEWLVPNIFWVAGVDQGWLGLSLLTQFLVFGGALTLCILHWVWLWWVSGLLSIFPAVFQAYSVYVVWFYWASSTHTHWFSSELMGKWRVSVLGTGVKAAVSVPMMPAASGYSQGAPVYATQSQNMHYRNSYVPQ